MVLDKFNVKSNTINEFMKASDFVKKIINIMLCITMAFSLLGVHGYYVSDEIRVFVVGQRVEFDVPPTIIDNRTLVPMRAIFEALNANVEWNEYDQSVTAERWGITIWMQIDNPRVRVSSAIYTGYIDLDVTPRIIENRTFVPLRVVAETLDANVSWVGEVRTVFIEESHAVATFNGINITADEVNPWIVEALWELEIAYDGEPSEQTVREHAVRMAAVNKLFEIEALRLGVYLTEADIAQTIGQIESFRQQMNAGNPGDFYVWLDDMGFRDEQHLSRALNGMQLQLRVSLEIIATPGEIERFGIYVETLAAKHILVSFDQHSDGDEAREIASGLTERARAGEDFDTLVRTYGQDPGMLANPQGYTFGPGMMVPEFEQGTRDLEIGGISEPIQSAFGFHIIKRVEPDPAQVTISPGNVRNGLESMVDQGEIVFLPALSYLYVGRVI